VSEAPDDIRALADLGASYAELRARWRTQIPSSYNIAADTVERWAAARPDRIALRHEDADGRVEAFTFARIDDLASRAAAGLRARGVGRGDRVAVYLGQRPETAIAHIAVYKLAAVAVCVSHLYGLDTLAHVLRDSGAAAIVTDPALAERVAAVRDDLPSLRHVIVAGPAGPSSFDDLLSAPPLAAPESTSSEDPALLLYTSGSTGRPKGLLHGHRVLAAYKPTIQLTFDASVDERSVLYTPADWAWVGGLLDTMLPGWAFGAEVVGFGGRFDAERTYELLSRHRVTHAFVPPTALKRMAQVASPRARWPLALRAISTGGEPLPGAVYEWLRRETGASVNEFYGLTEVNHLVGNCERLWPARAGSMGRAYPGHDTVILDEAGRPAPHGHVGQVAARRSDPTLFLGYWNRPDDTARLFQDEWVLTGDLALQDEDGYFWYRGRADEMIKSAGYRISPSEIEECLMAHPAVAEAAVIGKPDADRGQVLKAFVRLRDGHAADDALTRALRAHVRDRLAAFKAPREVAYVDSFPVTSSGKIRRSELRARESEA
jgi:acetyl-CoA synthetase